jgi:hypothetical protein
MGLQVVVEEMLLNRLLPGKKQPQPTNAMTESWATLVAAQVSIAELAAVLRSGRSTVGGHSIQISHQLEMAELDLLSARDALEKACWEMDLTVEPGDVRSPEPPAVSDSVPSAPPTGSLVAADAERPSGRRAGHQRHRRLPAQGQGELFPIRHPVNDAAAVVHQELPLHA